MVRRLLPGRIIGGMRDSELEWKACEWRSPPANKRRVKRRAEAGSSGVNALSFMAVIRKAEAPRTLPTTKSSF
jgi:hypothetical protein